MIKTNNSLFEVVSFNLRVTDLFYLQKYQCKQERRFIKKNQADQSNYFLVFYNRRKNFEMF